MIQGLDMSNPAFDQAMKTLEGVTQPRVPRDK